MEMSKIMKCKYKLFTDNEVYMKRFSNKATLSEMTGINSQRKEDKNGNFYVAKVRFKLLDTSNNFENVFKEYRLLNTDYRFTVKEVYNQ